MSVNLFKSINTNGQQTLVTKIDKNKELAYAFYLNKVNEEQYLVKKFSFPQFQKVIRKISSIKIDYSVLNTVEHFVEVTHPTEKIKLRKILYNSLNGINCHTSHKKTYIVKTNIITDIHKDQLELLNRLWKNDLKKLLYDNYTEKSNLNKNNLPIKDTLYWRLRFEENITLKIVNQIIKDFKCSLRQKYKKQKIKRKSLASKTEGEIIIEYLDRYITLEKEKYVWLQQFDECISTIKNIGNEQNYTYKKQIKSLGITILDKKEDIFRAIRFADSTMNCIRSDRKPEKLQKYIHGVRPINLSASLIKYMIKTIYFNPVSAVACIYKDPFTFIIDIKDDVNESIIGFVYGRLAINSQNGNFIIMVNNIYLRTTNTTIVEKILNIIEKSIGKSIKAEGIIYTDNWNKNLDLQHYNKESIKVIPLVGIKNDQWWLPQKLLYDDFFCRGNMPSYIQGYYKTLNNKSFAKEQLDKFTIQDKLSKSFTFFVKRIPLVALLLFLGIAGTYFLSIFKMNRNQLELYTGVFFTLVFLLIINVSFSKYKNYSQFRYLFIDYFSKVIILLLSFLFITIAFTNFT